MSFSVRLIIEVNWIIRVTLLRCGDRHREVTWKKIPKIYTITNNFRSFLA